MPQVSPRGNYWVLEPLPHGRRTRASFQESLAVRLLGMLLVFLGQAMDYYVAIDASITGAWALLASSSTGLFLFVWEVSFVEESLSHYFCVLSICVAVSLSGGHPPVRGMSSRVYSSGSLGATSKAYGH